MKRHVLIASLQSYWCLSLDSDCKWMEKLMVLLMYRIRAANPEFLLMQPLVRASTGAVYSLPLGLRYWLVKLGLRVCGCWWWSGWWATFPFPAVTFMRTLHIHNVSEKLAQCQTIPTKVCKVKLPQQKCRCSAILMMVKVTLLMSCRKCHIRLKYLPSVN